MRKIPERPSLKGIDEKFMELWDLSGIHNFDRNSKGPTYAIDTPPPTVSGELHVGSAFGFAHQDAIARFQRMRGRNVFFPMGWDDNGLPTERRVENFYGIRCDPSLPYNPDFQIPAKPDPKNKIPVSRPNFIELCEELTIRDEKDFEDVWRRLGLSVDWQFSYTTIGENARKTSQAAFINNLQRGEAYLSDAPTAWDVTFQTAVAQAEFEEREVDGTYHSLVFGLEDSLDTALTIDTTRPELLPACVALIANPNDDRYAELIGKTALTPLFKAPVPILAHELADPEKGTGLVMCCTFGDSNDVTWWRELQLPVKKVMERNGRLSLEAPEDFSSEAAKAFSELSGKTVFSARKRIVELLQESGEMIGEPRPIKHLVKFYEKGDRPLEIIPSHQWYIRNGGRDENIRSTMLEHGNTLDWHPEHMHVRYNNWTEGLNGDWLISRQRYFGVSFPLWYPIDKDGNIDRSSPIIASKEILPIDPSVDVPDGFTEADRGVPGGFAGDPDVMDTWATSSLSPQIAGRWIDEPELFDSVFPMNLRPQGPEIIRTWLYDTILRSELEHGELPWEATYINGWVLDPDRKKMSKSIGNVVTPKDYLLEYGADAFRYWANSASPGSDTAFSVDQIKAGRRLAIKILNASKLVLSFEGADRDLGIDDVTEPIDKLQLAVLGKKIERATQEFEKLNYSRALEIVESSFWDYCDDYLELIKQRAYGTHGDTAAKSAHAASQIANSLMLRTFAPHFPFVTDEVWSWTHDSSIHIENWPTAQELSRLPEVENAQETLDQVSDVVARIRGAKSSQQVGMKHETESVVIENTSEIIERLKEVESDIRDAGNIRHLEYVVGDVPSVDVTLAPVIKGGLPKKVAPTLDL